MSKRSGSWASSLASRAGSARRVSVVSAQRRPTVPIDTQRDPMRIGVAPRLTWENARRLNETSRVAPLL